MVSDLQAMCREDPPNTARSLLEVEAADLLAELVSHATGGAGRSLRYESAMELVRSIRFCLDAYFEYAGIADEADKDAWIRTRGLRKTHALGSRILRRRTAAARRAYAALDSGRLRVPLSAYQDTVGVELRAFFDRYDIELAAHDIPCSIDYPLALEDARGVGIRYVESWIEALRLETDFCRRFGEPVLSDYLFRFDARFGLDVGNAPFNLFSAVFDQAATIWLCGWDPLPLVLPREAALIGCRSLAAEIGGAADTASRYAESAVTGLSGLLEIADVDLLNYLLRYARTYTVRLAAALTGGTLEHIAVVDRTESVPPILAHLSDADSLDLPDYLCLLEDLQTASSEGVQAALILERVHSARDLADLLEADVLSRAALDHLFSRFGDEEMAVAGCTFLHRAGIPQHFIQDGDLGPLTEEASEEWHFAWLHALAARDSGQQAKLLRLAHAMRSD